MVAFDLVEFALERELGSLHGSVAETLRLEEDVTLLDEDGSNAAVRFTDVAVSLIILIQDRLLACCTYGRIVAPSRMRTGRSRPVQS